MVQTKTAHCNKNRKKIMSQADVAKQRPMTLGEKLKKRIYITRIVLSLVSMALYTAFSVVMLYRNWGSTVYNSIILGFVGVYILLFVVFLVLSLMIKSGSKRLTRSFKDYKSGLKIINSLLRLLSFVLTLSIFAATAFSKMISAPFQLAVLVISLLWAIFQIAFQTYKIRRRHKAAAKEKRAKRQAMERAALRQAKKQLRLSSKNQD